MKSGAILFKITQETTREKGRGKEMKTGEILGRCSECKKVGSYNEVRAYSLKEYDRIDFAFCSANCAQIFEDARWYENFYGMEGK